jgi:hypothetical protein
MFNVVDCCLERAASSKTRCYFESCFTRILNRFFTGVSETIYGPSDPISIGTVGVGSEVSLFV